MVKEKVCRKCKMFVEGAVCPHCKSNQFTTIYQGKIIFLDVQKSFIAGEMDVKEKGKYAIKIR